MRSVPLIAVAAAAVLAGSGGIAALDAPARITQLGYRPAIDPARFTTSITNRYWPIEAGRTWVYLGTKDGVPQLEVVVVKRARKTIMGVETVAVEDTVVSGGEIAELTTDWYAQDRAGNVWYFGEAARDYERARVTSTRGSWLAGVDGAQPGIVVKADPHAGGPTYRQEYRAGVAEDMGRVVRVGETATVPAGTFTDVLRTLDTDALNPGRREHKLYASGVGPIRVESVGTGPAEELELVSVTRPR
jgi:hypothetical protein